MEEWVECPVEWEGCPVEWAGCLLEWVECREEWVVECREECREVRVEWEWECHHPRIPQSTPTSRCVTSCRRTKNSFSHNKCFNKLRANLRHLSKCRWEEVDRVTECPNSQLGTIVRT